MGSEMCIRDRFLARTQTQMPMVVSARTRAPPIAAPIMVGEPIPGKEGEVEFVKIGVEELLGLSV